MRLIPLVLLSASVCAYGQFFGSNAPGSYAPATGDARTVTEPSYPPICSTVRATKTISLVNTINLDPYNLKPTDNSNGCTGGAGHGTLGCTGGWSYEPSSETPDNTTTSGGAGVQTALNACTSGHAVELIPGLGGELGFVMNRFSLPSGVSLILDPGIHVYASRDYTTYSANCGQIPGSCSNHWITAASTSGSGIYGLGTLDGGGWKKYTTETSQSFYVNRLQSYCNSRGTASHGSPACTAGANTGISYGPNAINLINASNFTMYKVTVKDCGNFCINYKGGTGGTFWGVKVFAPFEVSNTDGIDPLNATNVTIINSFISTGDNHIAVKSDATPTKNITVKNSQTGAGIGIVVGADTTYGISNVLVDTIQQNGNRNNDQSEGFGIGSDSAQGGIVTRTTFRNICMVNEPKSIRLYSNYGGKTGSSYPMFQGNLIQNVSVLPSTAPYTTGKAGTFTFQGLQNYPLLVQVDNLTVSGTNEGIETQGSATNDRYGAVTIGPGPVSSDVLCQLEVGSGCTGNDTGVSVLDTAGTASPYCTSSSWLPLIGELNLKSPVSNISTSYTGSGAVTLQAVLEPTTEINSKEQKWPTASVQFYEGTTLVGTAALSGDGTLAQYTLTPSSGSHTYTAKYPGDANYSAYTFGSVTVVAP